MGVESGFSVVGGGDDILSYVFSEGEDLFLGIKLGDELFHLGFEVESIVDEDVSSCGESDIGSDGDVGVGVEISSYDGLHDGIFCEDIFEGFRDLPDRSDDERRFGGLCLRERGEGHDSEGSEDMSSRKGSGHEEEGHEVFVWLHVRDV